MTVMLSSIQFNTSMERIHLVFPVVVQKGSWESVFHFASNRSSKEQVAEGLTGHRTKK